jgi:hypothetical protein
VGPQVVLMHADSCPTDVIQEVDQDRVTVPSIEIESRADARDGDTVAEATLTRSETTKLYSSIDRMDDVSLMQCTMEKLRSRLDVVQGAPPSTKPKDDDLVDHGVSEVDAPASECGSYATVIKVGSDAPDPIRTPSLDSGKAASSTSSPIQVALSSGTEGDVTPLMSYVSVAPAEPDGASLTSLSDLVMVSAMSMGDSLSLSGSDLFSGQSTVDSVMLLDADAELLMMPSNAAVPALSSEVFEKCRDVSLSGLASVALVRTSAGPVWHDKGCICGECIETYGAAGKQNEPGTSAGTPADVSN